MAWFCSLGTSIKGHGMTPVMFMMATCVNNVYAAVLFDKHVRSQQGQTGPFQQDRQAAAVVLCHAYCVDQTLTTINCRNACTTWYLHITYRAWLSACFVGFVSRSCSLVLQCMHPASSALGAVGSHQLGAMTWAHATVRAGTSFSTHPGQCHVGAALYVPRQHNNLGLF